MVIVRVFFVPQRAMLFNATQTVQQPLHGMQQTFDNFQLASFPNTMFNHQIQTGVVQGVIFYTLLMLPTFFNNI